MAGTMYQATAYSTPTKTFLSAIPSGAAGVRVTLLAMRALVQRAKKSWPIRSLAQRLVADLPQKDYLGEIRALHAFVRDSIRYTRDVRGVETLHTPEKIIELGQGDCDDKSLLLASLLESIGHQTQFKAVGFRPGHYAHVYPQVLLPTGKWLSLETTEPQGIGWEPPGIVSRMVVKNS